MVQRCDNHVAISPRCVLDVWASPITWQWIGPELCGAHGNRQCQAPGWCFLWFYCNICCVAAFETFESHNLHPSSCSLVFKSRSKGHLISMCFCPDRLTTWHTSCKLYMLTIYSFTRASDSAFTKSYAQLCHLQCHRFHVYMPHTSNAVIFSTLVWEVGVIADGELKMVELEAVLYCLNIAETCFQAVMML